MSKAYRVTKDGTTVPMERIHVRNEEEDLQNLLEMNPDLLAGDQIKPDDPCRWLLVDREIPVPDPESGSDLWSLDLFFVDQFATPTLVECKRFKDTRSRREVIAQMLDYAANASYYWKREDMLFAAEKAAQAQGSNLETRLSFLLPDWDEGPDEFFQKVEDNLREGQVRLVFFLEDAPWQLRSIVDFLNRQMERSEVLLVEARQYDDGQSRIVVPSLFGFTEEARRVKRKVSVEGPARKQWNKDMFLGAVNENIGAGAGELMNRLIDGIHDMGADMSWGTGAITGSCNPRWAAVSPKALIAVYTNGDLYLNFPLFASSENDRVVGDRLLEALKAHTPLSIADNHYDKYPTYRWAEWNDSIDGILTAIRETISAG